MYISPVILDWIMIAGASFCAGMIGFYIGWKRNEETIASTINYLVDEGFVKSFKNDQGELELIKIRDEAPNGSKTNPNEA